MVQVSAGRSWPEDSPPVYVDQNCVVRRSPPKVSTQHESTTVGSCSGHERSGFWSRQVWFRLLWSGYSCAEAVAAKSAAATVGLDSMLSKFDRLLELARKQGQEERLQDPTFRNPRNEGKLFDHGDNTYL